MRARLLCHVLLLRSVGGEGEQSERVCPRNKVKAVEVFTRQLLGVPCVSKQEGGKASRPRALGSRVRAYSQYVG